MSHSPPSYAVLFAAFAAAVSLSQPAPAELVQFEIQGGAAQRLVSLDSLLKDGIAYVPLQGLVEQAGGSFNVLPTRLRVDLGGSTAWLRPGESRVNALSIFSLARPIVEDPVGALIAVDDVTDFFLKSFRVTMRPLGPGEPSPPATMPGGAAETGVPPVGAPEATPPDSETLGARPSTISAVIIDAGHGGYDAGIESADQIKESALVLQIATRIKQLIDAAGGPVVILTRADDFEIRADQRLRIVHAAPGSLFISLHAGSSLSAAAEGLAVFYPSSDSSTGPSRADSALAAEHRRLAESIAAATAASAGVPLRGVVQAPLQLLGELQVPAVEIEIACLTSATDALRLTSDEHLARIATGIVSGITAYLAGAAPAATPAETAPAPEAN